jgi:hypothetical protein
VAKDIELGRQFVESEDNILHRKNLAYCDRLDLDNDFGKN